MEKFKNMKSILLIAATILSLDGSSCSMDFLDESQASSYLEKYGYLVKISNRGFGTARSSIELSEAIKDMQFNMNLEETGILDAATKKVMDSPRCGIQDERRSHRNRRYTIQGGKWKKTHLTWSLKTNKHAQLKANIRQDLNHAFEVWQSKSVITFEEVNDSRPDILIEFFRQNHGDGGPFDGPGGTLAHAFYPQSGKVHFDDDEHWIFGKDANRYQDGSNFFDACVHELGHTLGLAHSKVDGAIMFPVMKYDSRYLKLHEDEIQGISEIYGSNREPAQQTERPERTTPAEEEVTTPEPDHPTDSNQSVVPDCCDTSYDAIIKFRGELFIFKDEYNWRVTSKGVMAGYPIHTKRMWNTLPEDFKKVDAVYENQNGDIVFFIGKNFYRFDANTLKQAGYLSDLGLPDDLEKIDGIFVWGKTSETFIFSNARKEYWKFDEDTKRVEDSYPRRTKKVWKQIGDFDAAFQTNGITYFFKGKNYYEFDDKAMRMQVENPKNSASDWMKCQARPENGFWLKNVLQFKWRSKHQDRL